MGCIVQYKLRIKNKIFPVNIEQRNNELLLTCPYYPDMATLLNEIKQSFNVKKWNPQTKTWHIHNNDRAQYNLRFLTGTLDDPFHNPNYPDRTLHIAGLWPHQREAINKFLHHKKLFIAHEMGLGKTRAIYVAAELAKIASLLVICPTNVKYAWMQEYDKWHPNCPYPIFRHYQQVNLIEDMDPVDMVVFDESVFIKNPGAQRSRSCAQIAKIHRDNNSYIACLCGSPAPKNPTDWHNQIELLQPGYIREASPAILTQRLAEVTFDNDYPEIGEWKNDEIERFHQILQPITSIAFRHEVFPDERKQYIEIKLSISDQTKKTIKLLEDTIPSGLMLLERLREVSDGFLYDGKVTYYDSTPKDEATIELLREYAENGHNKFIIYAAYQASIDKCEKLALEAGWHYIALDGRGWRCSLTPELKRQPKPQQLLNLFQKKDTVPIVFIGHPKSAGVGLTLPAPAILYYSNTFNGLDRIQSEERTRQSCIIYDFYHLPCDRHVIENLKNKRNLQGISLGDVRKWLGKGSE